MPDNEPRHHFVETTNVGHNRDTFIFWFTSGGDKFAFVVTPDHAKQVMRILQTNIEKYEERFGPLAGRLPNEPMASPFPYDPKNNNKDFDGI